MVQSQCEQHSGHSSFIAQYRIVLQRHPVMGPIAFLAVALVLGWASLHADTVFPMLALFDISTTQVLLSSALVLWITGTLVGIINILERTDRKGMQATMLSQTKEQGYANRN